MVARLKHRRASCWPRRRRGTSVVEAAIVMTLLITLTMGLLQYGWMFTKWSQVQDAARQGARVAVLPSTTSSDSISNGTTGVVDTVMSNDGMSSSGYTVTIYMTHNGTKSLINWATLQTGDIITVVVQVTYSNVQAFSVSSSIVPAPSTLTATVSMTREGT